MNYEKIYQELILSKKKLNRYLGDGNNYDLHHILPRSLGGTDNEDNLVLLTYKEHFIAHKLLLKIFPGKAMRSALFIMMNAINFQGKDVKFSAREYEKIKLEYINSLRKKTVCLETGVVFASREEANSFAGLARFSADIVHCFNSDKTAGGYHWAQYEEGVDYTQNKWFGHKKEEKFIIIRLEDLKLYKTWKEAADDIDSTVGALSYALNTVGGTAKGYHFLKYDKAKDYSNNPYFGKKAEYNIIKGHNVKCTETGEIFNSVSELAQIKGYDVMRYQKEHNGFAKDGFHYVKLKYNKTSDRIKPRISRIKKIQCVETGEIFNNQADALRKYGIKNSGGICVAIKKDRKCAGFHWRYFDENNKNRENTN